MSVAGRDVVELGQISVEEAETMLERSLIDTDKLQDESMVEAFLSRVVCLPLAIAQAVAYIDIGMITIAEYIDIFYSTSQDAIELL